MNKWEKFLKDVYKISLEEFNAEGAHKHSLAEDKAPNDAEFKAEVFNKFNEAQEVELKKLIDDKATKEEIATMRKELAEATQKQFTALNAALKAMGLAIKKMSRQEAEEKSQSFSTQLEKQLRDNLQNLKEQKGGSSSNEHRVKINISTTKAMTITSNVTGEVPLQDRLEGFNLIPSRVVRLLDIMQQRGTTSNVVSWVFQTSKTGTAGQTAEAGTKNEIAFSIEVGSQNIKKTTAFIKVSTEMLDDITWIQSEIENELMREILKAVEFQAYEGDDTGNNHNGIKTQASAFDAGTFALSVDNANEVDVITVAQNQIRVNMEGEAEPNFILMHPDDVTRLMLEKLSATDKRYVDRLMIAGSTMMVNNVPIMPTTLVTVDDYLIGDFRKSLLITRQGMSFDIGLDGNDLTENLRTIIGEWRGATVVKDNDTDSFVAGDFATDAAALETA